jgi:hypothetical protein
MRSCRSGRAGENPEVGGRTQALYDEAEKRGWVVVSMRDDWKRLFPFDQ